MRRNAGRGILAGLLVLSAAGAAAQQGPGADPRLAAIDAALQAKDYAKARPLLAELSDTGHVRAAAILGALHERGLGGPKDEAASIRYVTLAAERGDEQSMMHLAEHYRAGNGGVAKDETQAIKWLDRAAAKGLWTAHYEVGKMLYERGDFAGAAARFEKGPADPGAKACRGVMYQLGRHYGRDPVAASRLFKDAMQGDGAFQRRAFACLEAGAGAGNPEAQYQMGALLFDGRNGVNADPAKGLQLMAAAAAQGQTAASARMGAAYWTGKGIARDPAKAFQLNLKAADAGDEQAAYYVGLALAQGDGVPADRARALKYFKLADYIKGADYQRALILVETDPVAGADAMHRACDAPAAVEWLKSAATRGVAAAQVEYGDLLSWNLCKVPEDKAGAVAWYRKAADQGYAPGMIALANAYLSGSYIKKDEARGIDLLSKAADRRSADAMRTLGEHYLQQANYAGLQKDMGKEAQLKQTGRGWMEKAIALGDVDAMKSMAGKAELSGAIYHGSMNGLYGGQKPDTWGKLVGFYTEALRYRRMAAAKGDQDSIMDVAELLAKRVSGQAIPGVTDEPGARRWFLEYLRKGGTRKEANEKLGELYENGRGGGVDRVRAYFLYDLDRAKYQPGTGKLSYRAEQLAKKMTPAEQAGARQMTDACRAADWKNCI